jgi:hypothetical protein
MHDVGPIFQNSIRAPAVENESNISGGTSKERRAAPRTRTFLKGVVYYDNRKISIDCTIRDLSDTGARLAFKTMVEVPDDIELYIPQRQKHFLAVVLRREPYEIGVSFVDQQSNRPLDATDKVTSERIAKIENDLVAVKRLLKRLEAKVFSSETDNG